MGLLAPALAAAGTPSPFDDYWYTSRSSYGVPVISADVALTISTVYACATVISEDIAKVPLSMYQDMGDTGSKPARNHPLHDLLHDQPNEYQTSLEWREMMTAFAILRGKGISEIRPGPRGPVDQLIPLHPDLVKEERGRGSKAPRYVYKDPMLDGAERTLLADEVFVLRGRFGRSVLDFASASLSTIKAQDEQARTFMQNGAKHQGVITHPKLLPDPVRAAVRKALDEYSVGGPRAGRPLLLEDGMEWHDVSIAPRDAEFLAQRQFSVDEVCRWFRVPPHKVANLERSTNNNIEKQSTEYVTDTLLAWAERWEQAILRDLILAKDTFYAKLLLDGLLRGDIESRFKAYALAIQWGFMTRNEVREREDLNPLPGLEDPLTPLNMTTDGQGSTAMVFAAPQPQLAAASDSATRGRLKLLASEAAARIVRREIAAMTKLGERCAGDQAAWRQGVDAFYAEQEAQLPGQLHIAEHEARQYAREQRAALIEHGPAAMDDWLVDRVAVLTDLAIDSTEAIAA